MAWILVSNSGSHKGVHWRLTDRHVILGRALGCDIVISDPDVSRRHCKLYQENDRVYLKDLGSRHLTHLNGEAIREGIVDQGDTVSLGSASFVVTRGFAPGDSPVSQTHADETRSRVYGPISGYGIAQPAAPRRDVSHPGPDQSVDDQTCPLLGRSRAMGKVRGLIRDIALTHLNILITGETGTGKELAAQMIHEGSARAHGPMISVNCAAIPPDLFESEMFGHEKGAFTSADKKRRGKFPLADGGTLFLDEIGELSSENQARLLRVLEGGVFYPVGAELESRADVRVIAATNLDLKRAVSDGRFRRDLYHRICAVEIELPALRQRPSDIPLLAEHFVNEFTAQAKHARPSLTEDALGYLQELPWSGNVRELRNAIERATALAKDVHITPRDFTFLDNLLQDDEVEGLTNGMRLAPLAEIECEHITHVLEQCNYNVSKAARVLGIHRNTLHNKIAEYGIGG